MAIAAGGMVLLPLLCGSFIDNIKDGVSLTEDAINFIILTVTMAIFSAIRGYSFNLLGERIVLDMRK